MGYVAALLMGGVVSFADFEAASWFALPRPFYFGLEFHPDAIVMMILMYMVQAVQTIGDVSSTAMGGFGRQATDQELGGAIKGQAICGMIGSVIGGLPTDPYSQNVGLICTTKVVARRVFSMVGVIMLLAGIFPKFSGLMATIPQPVLGGATVTVFCGHHHVGHPAAERAAPELPQPDDRGHRSGHRPGHRRIPRDPAVCAPAACATSSAAAWWSPSSSSLC